MRASSRLSKPTVTATAEFPRRGTGKANITTVLLRSVANCLVAIARRPSSRISERSSVDVLVSNRVVARGEVVIVGGNYGVRILDVVSPKERIRSMEA